MNILITVHTYLPNRDGVQFVTQYLAEGLAGKGHKVQIVTYMYPERSDVRQETINGVNVLRWNVKTVHTFHRGDQKGYQRYILKNYRQFDVMINVGTQTALTDWLFPVFSQIHIPKLLYLHSIWDFRIYRSELKNPAALAAKLWANARWKLYYRRYAAIFKQYDIVTQLHPMDYSSRLFSDRYHIQSEIVGNAAEEAFFAPEYNDALDVPRQYILSVANYCPRKNQKKCLELFYRSDIPEHWGFVFIGSSKNKYFDELARYNQILRKQLRLQNEKPVRFLANIDRGDIYTYVKRSSLYFSASTWEAFPISIIEAMAAGVPYISSNVGIIRFLSGGVVADKDEDYLYWLKLLTTDDDIRKSYGALGRMEAQKRYRISDKVDQLEKYLIRIAEGKQQH